MDVVNSTASFFIMAHLTGLEEYYVIKNNKKMRYGYTTGSCAAGAAKGAVRMLLFGKPLSQVELMTPKGILLNLELVQVFMEQGQVSCAVRKDGGDDPDNTHGLLIYATVSKIRDKEIIIDGGEGVGRVTRPGLWQKVGEAAINRVPQAMIRREVEEACVEAEYEGGIRVVIHVPQGEAAAQKTFNPRLGIVGGISILGTSGIVEPMSEAALVESIRLEMRQKTSLGEKYLLVTPGNYGEEYLREHMDLPFEKNMKCSNYIGETIDMAVELGVKGLLFVSHIGKFVKVGAGIMNTHSHSADGRMEVLCACALRAGADLDTACRVLDCSTTDEALEKLDKAGILPKAMDCLMDKIQYYLDHRSYDQILLGAVVFSNTHGFLGMTRDAQKLIEKLKTK